MAFYEQAERHVADIAALLSELLDSATITFSIQFFEVWKYLGEELERLLAGQSHVLAAVRRRIVEGVRPIGRFVGVARVFARGDGQLVDVLFDTSSGDQGITPYCCVVFSHRIAALLQQSAEYHDLHPQVDAFA